MSDQTVNDLAKDIFLSVFKYSEDILNLVLDPEAKTGVAGASSVYEKCLQYAQEILDLKPEEPTALLGVVQPPSYNGGASLLGVQDFLGTTTSGNSYIYLPGQGTAPIGKTKQDPTTSVRVTITTGDDPTVPQVKDFLKRVLALLKDNNAKLNGKLTVSFDASGVRVEKTSDSEYTIVRDVEYPES